MKRFLILMALAVPSSFMLMGASNHVWIDNPYAAPSGVNAQGTPFTSTPTGSPTPTVTNTPTPLGMQILSADCLSPVTFINVNARVALQYSWEFMPSTNLPATAQTIIYYPKISAGKTIYTGGSNQAISVANVTSAGGAGPYWGVVNSTTNGTMVNGLYILPRITPTQTCVITYIYQAYYSTSQLRWERRQNYYVLWGRDYSLQGPEYWKPIKVFTDPRNWHGV